MSSTVCSRAYDCFVWFFIVMFVQLSLTTLQLYRAMCAKLIEALRKKKNGSKRRVHMLKMLR